MRCMDFGCTPISTVMPLRPKTSVRRWSPAESTRTASPLAEYRVRPQFVPSPERMHGLRERLNLPRDRFVVLMMGGGLGIGPLERMMRALQAVELPLALVVIAGRNPRSERRVLAAAAKRQLSSACFELRR